MRKTIQATTILDELTQLEHATNAQVWSKVRAKLPNITLPSIHRTTVRMVQDGEIGGRLTVNGQVVLDSNPDPHSHFVCDTCRRVKDLKLEEVIINSIQSQIGQDIVHKNLVVHGTCIKCATKPALEPSKSLTNVKKGIS